MYFYLKRSGKRKKKKKKTKSKRREHMTAKSVEGGE
jgi:hypothetical protein